jgi:hypothetical protein
VAKHKHDGYLFQETHEPEEGYNGLVAKWASDGYNSVVPPARSFLKSALAGGVVVAVRRPLSCRSHRHLAKHTNQAVGMPTDAVIKEDPIDFHDFTFIGLYLDASIGITGANVTKLSMLAAVVASLRGLWAILWDWNLEPDTLSKYGWINAVNGEVSVPSGCSYTSTSGSGMMYDFMVMSRRARPMLLSHAVDATGYWKSHYGQNVVWDFDPDKCVARMLILPMVFRQPPAAARPRDPKSKRSRRAAEEDAKRAGETVKVHVTSDRVPCTSATRAAPHTVAAPGDVPRRG